MLTTCLAPMYSAPPKSEPDWTFCHTASRTVTVAQPGAVETTKRGKLAPAASMTTSLAMKTSLASVDATVNTMESPVNASRLTAPGKLQSAGAAEHAFSAGSAEVLSTVQVVAMAGAAQINPNKPASPVRASAERQSCRAVAGMHRSRQL